MSLENIVNSVFGLFFLVLISVFVICMGLMVYFYFTEVPVQLTDEERQQIQEKHQEDRTKQAYTYLWYGVIAFVLGWLTGNPQARTVGILCLIGAGLNDFHVLGVAAFVWYIIIPSLVVGAIIALFIRN